MHRFLRNENGPRGFSGRLEIDEKHDYVRINISPPENTKSIG